MSTSWHMWAWTLLCQPSVALGPDPWTAEMVLTHNDCRVHSESQAPRAVPGQCRRWGSASASLGPQVTKIFQKKKNSVTYSFRQSFSLYGMQVLLFENQCKSVVRAAWPGSVRGHIGGVGGAITQPLQGEGALFPLLSPSPGSIEDRVPGWLLPGREQIAGWECEKQQ